MRQDGMYYKVTQEYLHLNGEKRKLMSEREHISAKLEMIEGILFDLNDILCKHGNHIYEHFEEREPQESEGENDGIISSGDPDPDDGIEITHGAGDASN